MTFLVVVFCFSCSSLRITIMAKMRPISNNFAISLRVGSCGSYCDVQKSSAIGRQFGECDGVRIADRPFHFAKKCATSTSFDYYSNKLSLLLEISDKFTK